MFKRLGVSFMDEDHAALERLFGRVATTPDAGLAALFETIAAELGAHFVREESAMTEARAPILLAHIDLHQQILKEVERMRREVSRGGADVARHLIGAMLPLMVREHVLSADAASAPFLGRLAS